MSATGTSGVTASTSETASAACAQHPHVTQVGGQAPSSWPGRSYAVHGSFATRLTTPEALNVNNPTMIARTSLGTV